jgi:hypothetical protein
MKISTIKTSLFAAVLLIISFQSFSQDTIFYKNATKVVAIVKEVSQTEVQYKKVEMPDGPMYIVSKNDLTKIIYKNGYTEEIKATVVETPSQPLTVTYAAPISEGKPTISYSDTRRDSKLKVLINKHPDESVKTTLMGYHKSMRSLKAGQDATRTVAVVFGGITIATGVLTALIYSVDASAGESFAIAPMVTGGIAVVMCATAITLNVNLRKKRHAFVNLYNQ